MPPQDLIRDGRLRLDLLEDLYRKPEAFAEGEALFWNDPHISSRMLEAHLDPDLEAASRAAGAIDASVEWLVSSLELRPGDAILDLGCGPGLYAARFAERGLVVTGIDCSRGSVDHAATCARKTGLPITYRCQNFLTLDARGEFDAAFIIYGELCAQTPANRDDLLQRIRRALRPRGHLALDVSTREHRKRAGNVNSWYAVPGGFWKPGPHLVLKCGFDYPERDLVLDQYVVVEADGSLSVYRNWFQDYAPETITAVLEDQGFSVKGVWGDLAGSPYVDRSEWIGLVCQAR